MKTDLKRVWPLVHEDATLDQQERHYLCVLASHSNEDGVCTKSQATLAATMGCCERSIRSYTSSLQAKQKIHVRERKNRGRNNDTNVITLLFLWPQFEPQDLIDSVLAERPANECDEMSWGIEEERTTPLQEAQSLARLAAPAESEDDAPLSRRRTRIVWTPFVRRAGQLQRWYAHELVERDLAPERWEWKNATRLTWTEAFFRIATESCHDDGLIEDAIRRILDNTEPELARKLFATADGPLCLRNLDEVITEIRAESRVPAAVERPMMPGPDGEPIAAPDPFYDEMGERFARSQGRRRRAYLMSEAAQEPTRSTSRKATIHTGDTDDDRR